MDTMAFFFFLTITYYILAMAHNFEIKLITQAQLPQASLCSFGRKTENM